MPEYSQDLIHKTLDFWKPRYKKIGVEITEKDAIEILDNVTEVFRVLMKWNGRIKREDD